jgi:hypothetical protein
VYALVAHITLTWLIPLWTFGDGDDVLLLLPFGTAIIASFAITFELLKLQARYMLLSFWVYIYIMFGVAAGPQIGRQWWPWPGQYSDDQITLAYLMLWLGILLYLYFYRAAGRRTALRSPEDRKGPDASWVPLLWFAGSVAVLSLAAVVLLWTAGQDFFALRQTYTLFLITRYGTEAFGLILLVTRTLPLLALLWVILELRANARRPLPRRGVAVIVLILLIVLALTSNPINSARWWLGTVGLSILLAYFGTRQWMKAFLGIGVIVAYIFVYPISDLFRNATSLNDTLYYTEWSRDALFSNFISGDYDSLQQILNSLTYVSERGIVFGRQILGLLAFWIPRRLWPAKPIDTGVLLAEYMSYNFTNLSSSLWVEGFMNFGYLGVAAFLGFWGRVCGSLDKVFNEGLLLNRARQWQTAIFFFMVPGQHLFLRGSLLVAAVYLFIPILALLLWNRLRESLSRRPT